MKDKEKYEGIGLVLGGGGARGFFHLGVIKALQELKIPIVEISGTSIGAAIGSILAHNPQFDFNKIIDNFNYLSLVSISSNSTGLISSKKIEKYTKDLLEATRFSELKIPFSCNAVDINTGKEVVFRKGRILPAVMASMAIPGIFPLVKSKNRILCDGGLINVVPVDLISRKDIPLVVSDIRLPKRKITVSSSKKDVLFNSYLAPRYSITNEKLAKEKEERKVFHIAFRKKHGLFSFNKKEADKLVQAGYKSIHKHKKQFKKILNI